MNIINVTTWSRNMKTILYLMHSILIKMVAFITNFSSLLKYYCPQSIQPLDRFGMHACLRKAMSFIHEFTR